MKAPQTTTTHLSDTFTPLHNKGADVVLCVGVYLRISDDQFGDAKGVARQREDCTALCAVRRWKPEIYEDNDVSAYRKNVVRKDFERMLADLESGEIRGIVAYNLDRLVRRPKDLERLIDIYEEKPNLTFTTLQGDINLTTSDGRAMARVLVTMANKASDDTGRRVKRKQLELAQSGHLVHCGRTPFGWLPDNTTADPKAKAEILKAHERLLAGDRMHAIREDWEARGVLPRKPDGGRYGEEMDYLRRTTLTRILTNPALAGIKMYRGEVVTDDSGRPVKPLWEPICTPEELDAVLGVLERRRRGWTPSGVSYLLSGIARCGKCMKPMRGQLRRSRPGTKVPTYTCHTDGSHGGCGGVGRLAEPVDEMVIELVLEDQVRQQMMAELPAQPWAGEAELGSVLEEISELEEATRKGVVSVSVMLKVMPGLEARRDDLLRQRRASLAEVAAATVITVGSRDEFDAQPLDRQRALVLKTISAVVIHPAGRGRRKFNPDLIEPIPA